MKLIKSIHNCFLKLFKSESKVEDKKTKSTSQKRTPEVTPVKKRRGRPPKKN